VQINVAALRGEVAARPWTAIAIGFAVGAYVAFERSGPARRAMLSSLGATLIGALRDLQDRQSSAAAGSRAGSDWPS